MEVICLEEAAFYELLYKVYERFKSQHNVKEDKWISGAEAMRMLRIKSPATLQNLRDTDAIHFSQPSKELILYDVDSIHEYLNDNTPKPF